MERVGKPKRADKKGSQGKIAGKAEKRTIPLFVGYADLVKKQQSNREHSRQAVMRESGYGG